jgi:hypothetical protein
MRLDRRRKGETVRPAARFRPLSGDMRLPIPDLALHQVVDGISSLISIMVGVSPPIGRARFAVRTVYESAPISVHERRQRAHNGTSSEKGRLVASSYLTRSYE